VGDKVMVGVADGSPVGDGVTVGDGSGVSVAVMRAIALVGKPVLDGKANVAKIVGVS